MKVYFELTDLPAFQHSVITIGSFDGVHNGHRRIITTMCELAHQYDSETIVITFYPHPRSVVDSAGFSLKLLTTLKEKIRCLENTGIDHLVIVPFTKLFAQQSPADYIQNFLVKNFHPQFIVIGYDHRFGANRSGDIHLLQQYQTQFDYRVVEIPMQQINDLSVSSTKIRNFIAEGNIKAANTLLGYPYILSGKVVRGDQIGRKMGYPTANIALPDNEKLLPKNGIYAINATVKNKTYQGMLYIGERPTLHLASDLRLEVNLFDFDKDIYDETIHVDIIDYVRGDKKLSDLAALQAQIEADKTAVKQLLKQQEKLIAVVILNYNGLQHLQTFLPSVVQYSPEAVIYLADNGSTDASVAWVCANHATIKIIELPQNLGFAGGYNAALQHIPEPFYVLLNSDVAVTHNWLTPMLQLFLHDKSIGILQPKILSYRQKEYFEYAGACGGMMDFLGYSFCRGRILDVTEKDTSQYNSPLNIFWASGAALFIRKELYHALGGFDADYFAHWEEIDLCWRVHRAGCNVICEPTSVVYHLGGGTLDYDNPHKVYLNFRNTLFTLLKNESASKLFWLIVFRLSLDGIAGIAYLKDGKWANLLAVIKAHFAFYGAFLNLLQKRKYYNQLVDNQRIKNKKLPLFNKSILWQFYIRRKHKFSELVSTVTP